MNCEPAETYLRNLAESELRRYRGEAAEFMPEATERVRAVAAAFTQTGALDQRAAEEVIEELMTALEIRSPGGPPAPYATARVFQAHRLRAARQIQPGPIAPAPTPAGASPVSVTPVGELLELRGGDTDMVVYLVAAISTPHLASLSAGVLSLPKGSLPHRISRRGGLPPGAPLPVRHGPILPGVPHGLRAVDPAGESYDLVFNGGGDGTWSAGHFQLLANPPGQAAPADAGWLDIGNEETSVRIDLTADSPAVQVATTANGLTAGEQFLRARAEAMFASGYHDLGTDLKGLAAVVQALRAVGMLPADSAVPGLVAALCHRYAVSREDIPGPPAALPDRWASLLTGDQHAAWPPGGTGGARGYGGGSPHAEESSPPCGEEPDGADPAAATPLAVALPETDGVTTVLSGLVTHGRRTTLIGAYFGTVEEGYPEGPCIWLRDDLGQWHVAKQRNWSSGQVIVFRADVVPPVPMSASSADILVIGRTADVRASVPLTWWTS